MKETVLPTVKENDKVIFDKYAAIEFEYLNEKYLIVNKPYFGSYRVKEVKYGVLWS